MESEYAFRVAGDSRQALRAMVDALKTHGFEVRWRTGSSVELEGPRHKLNEDPLRGISRLNLSTTARSIHVRAEFAGAERGCKLLLMLLALVDIPAAVVLASVLRDQGLPIALVVPLGVVLFWGFLILLIPSSIRRQSSGALAKLIEGTSGIASPQKLTSRP